MKPPIQKDARLYIITREDLKPGARAAQSAHAAFQFAIDHPKQTADWHEYSQYLILLSVPDEAALYELLDSAVRLGIARSTFNEPDFNDQLTAIALEPTDAAKELCKDLPLTLSQELAMT